MRFLMKKGKVKKLLKVMLVMSPLIFTNAYSGRTGLDYSGKFVRGEKFTQKDYELKQVLLGESAKNLIKLEEKGINNDIAVKSFHRQVNRLDEAKHEMVKEKKAVRRGELSNLEILATVPRTQAFDEFKDTQKLFDKKQEVYYKMVETKRIILDEQNGILPDGHEKLFEEQKEEVDKARKKLKMASRKANLLNFVQNSDVKHYQEIYNRYAVENGDESRKELIKYLDINPTRKDEKVLAEFYEAKKDLKSLRSKKIDVNRKVRHDWLENHQTAKLERDEYKKLIDDVTNQEQKVKEIDDKLKVRISQHNDELFKDIAELESNAIKEEKEKREKYLTYEDKINKLGRKPTEKELLKLNKLITSWENSLGKRRRAHRLDFIIKDELRRRELEKKKISKIEEKLNKDWKFMDGIVNVIDKYDNMEERSRDNHKKMMERREQRMLKKVRQIASKDKDIKIGESTDDCQVCTKVNNSRADKKRRELPRSTKNKQITSKAIRK